MVHVLVHHKVADYGRWKEAFDSHLSTRKRAGETGCHVFHNLDNPRDIYVLLDWETVDEARKFINSSELQETMKKSGVQGLPEVQYLEDVYAMHRTAAD